MIIIWGNSYVIPGERCVNIVDNKKICLVTFYKSNNYGTNLQALALETVLKKWNYDVSFLKTFQVKSEFLKHPMLLYAWLSLKHNLEKNHAFYHPEAYDITLERKERIEQFQKKYFKEVSYVTNNDWKEAINENVIFVAGSDIIWNPVRGYPGRYFLDFAYYGGFNRFSYASSVGELEFPQKYYRAYKRYLRSMVAVGVREQSVADKLTKILGIKVNKVVDPTLLLTREEWMRFSKNSIVKRKTGFILCYFVMKDERYWKYMDVVSKQTQKSIIVLPMHYIDEQQPYEIITNGTAYEFVWLIEHADFVCTDSFHACAISTIFNKDFYLLKRIRKSEDEKYNDFLVHYHLTDRVVVDENRFDEHKTNYKYANELLIKDRELSYDFLDMALSKC